MAANTKSRPGTTTRRTAATKSRKTPRASTKRG